MLELLLLDEKVKSDIKKLMKKAINKPITESIMTSLKDDETEQLGFGKDFGINISSGHRIVYTIEEHPIGMCKHISISLDEHIPSLDDVDLIISEFDFNANLIVPDDNTHVYIEKITDKITGDIKTEAINIIELI